METKKNKLETRQKLDINYFCVADSRFPKMPVIRSQKALVHPQTQELSCVDRQSPTPTLQTE
jgi:hypothetical protein